MQPTRPQKKVKALSVFTLSRGTEIKVFCSTQHNSCSANAVLDSRWIEQKFQSCGARDQNFLLKMKCVMNMYENWHNQIKQCHCFMGYTSALSINNSELQFLGIYLPLKSDQVKGLMGALGFNL